MESSLTVTCVTVRVRVVSPCIPPWFVGELPVRSPSFLFRFTVRSCGSVIFPTHVPELFLINHRFRAQAPCLREVARTAYPHEKPPDLSGGEIPTCGTAPNPRGNRRNFTVLNEKSETGDSPLFNSFVSFAQSPGPGTGVREVLLASTPLLRCSERVVFNEK